MNALTPLAEPVEAGREAHALPTIRTILLSCPCSMIIEVGTWPSCLDVVAEGEASDAVSFAIDADTLTVWANDSESAADVTVHVRTRALPELIENHEAGTIRLEGIFSADYLTLRNEGSGTIHVNATGAINVLDVEQDGSGAITVDSPAARKGILTALRTSQGGISAHVTDEVEANAWGAGIVRIKGAPAQRLCSVGDGVHGGTISFEDLAV